MANDLTTNPRLWSLDTVGSALAAGNTVWVRGVHYEPTTAADVLRISEYAPDGSTAQTVIRLKCGAAVENYDVQYSSPLRMNGVYLSEITHGVAYLLIDRVDTKITA